MGHGASTFFVGGVICHVDSVSLCTEKKREKKNKKKNEKQRERRIKRRDEDENEERERERERKKRGKKKREEKRRRGEILPNSGLTYRHVFPFFLPDSRLTYRQHRILMLLIREIDTFFHHPSNSWYFE